MREKYLSLGKNAAYTRENATSMREKRSSMREKPAYMREKNAASMRKKRNFHEGKTQLPLGKNAACFPPSLRTIHLMLVAYHPHLRGCSDAFFVDRKNTIRTILQDEGILVHVYDNLSVKKYFDFKMCQVRRLLMQNGL